MKKDTSYLVKVTPEEFKALWDAKVARPWSITTHRATKDRLNMMPWVQKYLRLLDDRFLPGQIG